MSQSRPIPRREAIRLGGLLLALGQWSRAAPTAGAFEFIVVNDTHYIDEMCRPWQAAVVAEMRASAPDAAFCAIVGDVTDRGQASACLALKEIYGAAATHLYTVPGNHDYVTDTDRTGYDAAFPNQLNYVFQHMGWQFLALDTTQGTRYEGTEISGATLAWMDQTIGTLDRETPTFVFTHFPLGSGAKYRPTNADEVINRLLGLNVKWVHNGHWHGESIRPVGELAISTSRCCARLRDNHDRSPKKGWHVYRAEVDGKLSRRFVEVPKI